MLRHPRFASLSAISAMSAIVLALVAAVPASAQNAPPVRIRGTVESIEAGSVNVLTREGKQLKLATSDATRYSAIKALDMSSIKQGSFIGTAGKPTANGGVEALEVVVFPEEARGSGEGHYDWDLLPGSSMTNATVSAVVSGNSGRELNLTYQGKNIQVKVPQNVPVVTFVPATAADLKAGLTVFVIGARDAADASGEKLKAVRVVMEKDGVKPPM
ncbi:hypothetical protein PQR62_24630 [Herbaspirillum lusitanum]|uniref:DUF5666 domain-containing protein n=1 Tax=Herbaspirillum lusitanum TaxID=213312 RepID=A0ABW9AEZ2_9BURK